MRGPRDSGRRALDRQALGAVRLNAHAVAAGRRAAGPLAVSDIEGMHRLLFEGTEQPFVPGRFRDREVWIGAPGTRSPARAHYVPAPHEFVPSLMADLVEYVSSPSWVHPLVTAAVAHLQFETIHPFLDGNGRVGRALILNPPVGWCGWWLWDWLAAGWWFGSGQAAFGCVGARQVRGLGLWRVGGAGVCAGARRAPGRVLR